VEFSGSGFALSDNSRPLRLFKIVSGTNPYTATPVHLKESDGSRPNDGTSNITAAQKVLHEVNAVSTVKADTIVEATPNEYGTGWYFTAPSGSGCGLPFVFKVQVGTTVAKSAGHVIDVYARYRTVTVDANGCVSISAPTCETAATESCSTVEDTNYYCISGVCWKYYDGIVPGSYDAGPFSTPELCDADCPFPPAGEGVLDCCPTESHGTLTATISGGHGTMTLTWDGSQYWQGSKALSCGEMLHFRYDKDCGAPDYSCDGSTWLPCPASIGTPTCTPFADPRTFDTDMNDVNAGCAAGSCGALSVTVAV
jgi:hypothetical protein